MFFAVMYWVRAAVHHHYKTQPSRSALSARKHMLTSFICQNSHNKVNFHLYESTQPVFGFTRHSTPSKICRSLRLIVINLSIYGNVSTLKHLVDSLDWAHFNRHERVIHLWFSLTKCLVPFVCKERHHGELLAFRHISLSWTIWKSRRLRKSTCQAQC